MSESTKSVKVRDVEQNDANELNRLYTLLLGSDYGTEATMRGIAVIESEPYNEVLIAEYDGRVAGTIQVTICDSPAFGGRPHGVIEYLVVFPEMRRRGIATALMKAAEAICLERQVSCIELVSGNDHKEAHIFYQNAGYRAHVKGFRKDFL